MLKESLIKIFTRDITKLKDEISAYDDESKLWIVSGEIKNSAGNLCLHLTGNLRHFIGGILGDSGFKRDRESEFNSKNIPKTELIKAVDETLSITVNTLKSLREEDLQKNFPVDVFKEEMTTGFFLIHLSCHLNYHLGQINYHRRLLDQ
jgi:uncharacterized damage-inducible protein DinB